MPACSGEDALSLEATDKDASDRAYQQAEQLLFDNAVAVFALDAPQDFAVRNNVEGFKVNPLYGYDVFFWELSRKPKRNLTPRGPRLPEPLSVCEPLGLPGERPFRKRGRVRRLR